MATLLNSNGLAVASNGIFESNVTVGPVAPGEYRLRITSHRSFPALYEGIECASDCLAEFSLGTPIKVMANTISTDVTMDLRSYPRLAGQISAESGQPIAGVTLNLILPNSGIVLQSFTDSNGSFLFPYVPTGSYLLHASAIGWTDELYDNIACESFNPPLECPGGSLLHFTSSSSDRTLNMQLARAASVSGTVTQNYSSASNFADFYLLDANGTIVRGYSSSLGTGGSYTMSDIPPGTYFIAARGFNSIPQLHALIDCPAAQSGNYATCNLAAAQPLTFDVDSIISGIDFNLRSAGARRVQVLSAETGLALPGVTVDLWRNSLNRIGSRMTDATGYADVGIPFFSVTENFYVSTDNALGLIDEVYDNVACPNGSVYFGLCALTGGTPLILPAVGIEPPLVITLVDPNFIFGHGFEDARDLLRWLADS